LGGNFIKDERVRISGVYLVLDAAKTHLGANSKQKWIKILFAVLVFLLFSVFSAYLNYNYCSDADFPSSKPKFETLDQNDLLADELNKFEISRPGFLPIIIENIYPEKVLPSFQKCLYDQELAILLC
jgi:hypothetical protein